MPLLTSRQRSDRHSLMDLPLLLWEAPRRPTPLLSLQWIPASWAQEQRVERREQEAQQVSQETRKKALEQLLVQWQLTVNQQLQEEREERGEGRGEQQHLLFLKAALRGRGTMAESRKECRVCATAWPAGR